MGLQLFIRRQITDGNGKTIKDTGLIESKSLVLGFLRCLFIMMDTQYGVLGPILVVIDTGNNPQNMHPSNIQNQTIFSTRAPATTSTYGIVVGSGVAAESNSDYALQIQIAHGALAGELGYGATTITAAAIVGANVDLTIQRVFTNTSPGNVTINEIGIYHSSVDSGATQRYFCMLRDVLAAPDVVPNAGGQDTVTYILRTTI